MLPLLLLVKKKKNLILYVNLAFWTPVLLAAMWESFVYFLFVFIAAQPGPWGFFMLFSTKEAEQAVLQICYIPWQVG